MAVKQYKWELQKQINYPVTTEHHLVHKQKALASFHIDTLYNKCDSYSVLPFLSLSSGSVHKSVSYS